MKLVKKSLVFLFAFVAALSVAMMNDTSASAAELRNSGDTFDQLAAYITDSGTYSGGYYTISETVYSSGSNYYSVYSMSNRGSYIRFSYKVSNLTSSYIGNTLNVDLYRDSRNLSVSFSMNFYQSGSLIDSASKSCTIDRSIYTN